MSTADADDPNKTRGAGDVTRRWHLLPDQALPGARNWRLQRPLGRGAFGEVWLARHQHTHEDSAVKFCLNLTQQSVLSVQSECILLGRMQAEAPHATGIVRLRDTHLDEEPYWLRFDFIPGGTLAGQIDSIRQMSPALRVRESVRIVRELAGILGRVHGLSRPIVHRDLKPGNILVQPLPNGPRLMITDFGIGGAAAQRSLEQEETDRRPNSMRMPSVLLGTHTPLYASWQQARGFLPDPTDDIHALGVIWFQLLLADLAAKPRVDRLGAMHRGDVATLRLLGLSQPGIDLLADCVHPEERRPANGQALVERLQRLTNPVARSSRPLSRNDIVVAMTGPADFQDLAEAVRHAPPDAIIHVRPGIYRRGLVLARPVQIIGDGPLDEIVLECDDASCIAMRTDRATVRGLTIRCLAGFRGQRVHAVDIPRGSLLLEGCDILSDSLACVGIVGKEATPTVRGCRIHGGNSSGVFVSDEAKAHIEKCDIFANAGPGIVIRTGADPMIRDCTIRDGQDVGLFVSEAGRGTVENCDIHANRSAGLAISSGGDPTLRGCAIRQGRQSGVFVADHGTGTLEECEIHGNASAGVAITTGGNPTLRGCRVRDGRRGGVFVYRGGRGVVEGCDIFGNAFAGIEVKTGGDPVVRDCAVHDGGFVGVIVAEGGRGTFETCDIFGNAAAGVAISVGGDPVVRGCMIHAGLQSGVVVSENGKGIIDRCDIYANTFAGVQIKRGGDPVVRGCMIHDGGQSGVFVSENGKGIVEGCDIHDNAFAGVEITTGGDPVVRGCTIRDGRQGGLVVYDRGSGTVEDCDIVGNIAVGVVIDGGHNLIVSASRVRNNGGVGVKVLAAESCRVENCVLTDNRGGAWNAGPKGYLIRINNRE